MPLRAEYTLHQSDLTEFLSAPVWEERNGAALSVLSALARLDIDPWAEAARLAALPRDAAASALAVILRRLPEQRPEAPDTAEIADRLVKLLPKGGSATTVEGIAGGPIRPRDATNRWLLLVIAITLLAWALVGFWS
ncbi:hypothetical protein [Azospirillum sp. ST 5-10]|uniref:hypothetical protein n=1 Tax=unclassified Azospirillum TaxID=2630922 RepID=UPI003F4A1522